MWVERAVIMSMVMIVFIIVRVISFVTVRCVVLICMRTIVITVVMMIVTGWYKSEVSGGEHDWHFCLA
jgi:hypothetical protein